LHGYDNASRLASVSDGNGNAASYSYLANSSLVGQIAFAHSGTTEMTTIKQYDYLNRLSSISSTPSNSFIYQYNAANQRTLSRFWDGSYWRYGYDSLGEVTSGNKYWSDMTPVAGQQFGYAFDTIGNRTETEAGGDQTGANLRVANYTNNALNQITSRDVPGYVDIMGNTLATNTVSVNGQAAYQKVEYFRDQFQVTNTSSSQWQSMTVSAPGQGSVTGHAFVAQTPETYTYDADGNLLSDGRWNYTWDAENRLINITSLSSAPSGSQLQLTFAYDYQGRRIQKAVYTWSGSSWVISGSATNFAYDGWNCIGVLNSSLGLVDAFVWGSDLSGSMQGAGGAGGLLEASCCGEAATNCFAAFDGNGNVSALVNVANGATLANYEYGPFGEVIRATGPMAKLNPFRFSTKYEDDETDMLYYGYRYYNPSTGRWLSRDPLEEQGGDNLYSAMYNDPVDCFDLLGLIINGPDNIVALDKTYPNTQITAYTTDKICKWTVSGPATIIGPDNQASVTIYPTSESKSVGDVVLKNGMGDTKPVTVRRPKYLSRVIARKPITSTMLGLVGVSVGYNLTVKDQFSTPMPGLPVSEAVKVTIQYRVAKSGITTGTTVTDSTGTFGDVQLVWFYGSSGHISVAQTIMIGNWAALLGSSLYGNGTVSGTMDAIFQ
jgi:RHS repeat-associated protein